MTVMFKLNTPIGFIEIEHNGSALSRAEFVDESAFGEPDGGFEQKIRRVGLASGHSGPPTRDRQIDRAEKSRHMQSIQLARQDCSILTTREILRRGSDHVQQDSRWVV